MAEQDGSPDDHLVVVDGVFFPKFFETNRPMKEQIECIKALEMRDDDVILCAFPKCGTHWLWEVGSMLLSGKAEHDKRAKEFAMMEATEIEKTRALPSPRLLNTHVPVSMLPRQVKDKKVKVIHVYRNVKDVTVSLFFHAKQNPGMENFTIDLLMNTFFSDKGRKGNYFAYLKGMDEFIKSNPDIPVFNVSYEDTKEVADACSFQKMKEVDSSKDTLDHLPRVQMYRKGEVGDWKNHLTVAQSERLDAAMKELEGCDFRFRYTL
nr:hypothetical protein BaRGS_026701 [Batillaria attramentaria]